MSAWAAVLLAGVGSYLFRVTLVLVADRVTLPAWFECASAHVMPAAFAALVVLALAEPLAQADPLVWPALLGTVVTGWIAARRSAGLAVLGGLLVTVAGAALLTFS
jgi:branched-subunit amino acid transport protein